MEKLTNREMLNLIKEELSANANVVAWCDHQIELLDNKKNANSAKSKENQETALTITDILALPEIKAIVVEDKPLTNQKLSYLLNHDNRITREVVKKKAYFKVC